MQSLRYWGIDGCKSQWFGFGLSADGHRYQSYLCPTMATMWKHMAPHKPHLVLTDMAIGLCSLAEERACDLLARAMLQKKHNPDMVGLRRASVFPVLCRQAMDRYHQATKRRHPPNKQALLDDIANHHRHITGRGVSAQAKNIVPAMADMDRFLMDNPRVPIREMHPEIAFAGLNGGRPLTYYKKTPEGEQERLQLLRTYLPQLGHWYSDMRQNFAKTIVSGDDILDAVVGAITGYVSQHHKLQRLHAPQNKQPIMEIVFVQPANADNMREIMTPAPHQAD